MNRSKRVWALFFLFLAVIGLLLLSSGLANVSLSSEWGIGDFGAIGERRAGNGSATGVQDRLPTLSVSLLRLVFILTMVLAPLAFFFALFSAETRRALTEELKKILPFALWMITLFYLLQRLELNPTPAPTGRLTGASSGPPDWITNPTSLVAFVVASVMLLAISGIGWYVWRRTRPGQLERIAQQAQLTLDQLSAGHNFQNAIIDCYYRMCRLLRTQRIERGRSMTPREFAAQLQALGVGGEEVQRLTGLFEGVRYGGDLPGEAEEQEAVKCLSALISAAQEPRGAGDRETAAARLTEARSGASKTPW